MFRDFIIQWMSEEFTDDNGNNYSIEYVEGNFEDFLDDVDKRDLIDLAEKWFLENKK